MRRFGHAADVIVPPVAGTVVVFRSDTVLHRTLPSFHSPRTCFTIWFESDDAPNAPLSCALPPALAANLKARRTGGDVPYSETWASFADQLSTSPANRIFARLVYRSDFEASLRECFSATDSPDADERVKLAILYHEAHVRAAPPALAEVADALAWVVRQRE